MRSEISRAQVTDNEMHRDLLVFRRKSTQEKKGCIPDDTVGNNKHHGSMVVVVVLVVIWHDTPITNLWRRFSYAAAARVLSLPHPRSFVTKNSTRTDLRA